MLKRIHHVAIIVSDYPKSRAFYVDKLGFEVVRENYRPARRDYKLDLRLGDAELEIFGIPQSPERPSYPEARGLRPFRWTTWIRPWNGSRPGALSARMCAWMNSPASA